MIALSDCAVAVSNANEVAKWWTEKLGFAVHRVGTGKHAIMVAPPGDRFILHLCEGFEQVGPGNTGVAFVTDDIVTPVRKVESGGVRFPTPLKKESWGRMAKFEDPDRNVYWLLEVSASFIRKEVGRIAPRRVPQGEPRSHEEGSRIQSENDDEGSPIRRGSTISLGGQRGDPR